MGLRLALNATARACAEERAGIAGLITSLTNVLTYCGRASGTPRRALDSAQGKPCSVALLGLAFTMAEILLSLTIIGVVAAITLPSLTGNINERTWNTQRKALYARFSQAIALMPALNGYGTLKENTDSAGSTSIEDTAAETFVTAGLSKVLKINNICDSEHLLDCGLSSKITTIDASVLTGLPSTIGELNPVMISAYTSGIDSDTGNSYAFSHSAINSKVAAFETANGESIAVYYNPVCQSDMNVTTQYNVQPKVCANFVYDLNGTKGPNTVGKDIGIMTVLYPSDSVVVAPVPESKDLGNGSMGLSSGEVCTKNDSATRLPNRDEVVAMFVNKRLLGLEVRTHYWSNTRVGNGIWRLHFDNGRMLARDSSGGSYVRCVKR